MTTPAVQTIPFEDLADLLYRILARPHTLVDLGDLLVGATPGDDPLELIDTIIHADHRIAWQPDSDIYFRPDAVFAGATLTHRVTDEELASGTLTDSATVQVAINLLLDRAGPGSRAAVDGPDLWWVDGADGPYRSEGLESPRARSVAGPDGWLAACRAGRLCGFRLVEGEGPEDTDALPRLEFLPVVDEPEPDALAAFTDAVEQAVAHLSVPAEPAVDIDMVLARVILDHPGLFEVVPPVEETAMAAGIQVRGYRLAPAGFDWDTWDEELPLTLTAQRFRLEPGSKRQLAQTLDIFNRWRRADSQGASAEADEIVAGAPATLIANTILADAFGAAVVVIGTRMEGGGREAAMEAHETVTRFASALAAKASGPARVPYLWLASVGAAVAGDGAGQLALLEEAFALDQGDVRVAEDLGYCRVDQSRYQDAQKLLSRAGAQGPVSRLVEELTRAARASVGRNDPCPCGSGRKFKQCHARGDGVSAADATAALYQKPLRLISADELGLPDWTRWSGRWRSEEPDVDWQAGIGTLDDLGVFIDLLLAEAGGLARFVELRSDLLPADEVAVAQRWLEVPRGLFRVDRNGDDGAAVSLEPVDGGDPLYCAGDPAAAVLDDGSVVVARPLPIGAGRYRLFSGVVTVAESQMEETARLLADSAGDAEAIARGLARLLHQAHSGRDDQVLYFALVSVEDPDRLADWDERRVRFDPTPSPDLRVGALEDGTIVLRSGDDITLISYSAADHEATLDGLADEVGPHRVTARHAVTADALRGEVLMLNRDVLDGPPVPGADPRGEFDSALVTRILETGLTLGIRSGGEFSGSE